jgi:hypothetical protein
MVKRPSGLLEGLRRSRSKFLKVGDPEKQHMVTGTQLGGYSSRQTQEALRRIDDRRAGKGSEEE